MARVPDHSHTLTPQPGERGLASGDPASVTELVTGAWDALIGLAAAVDLDAPAGAEGLPARDLLVPLGAWDDRHGLTRREQDVHSVRVAPADDEAARVAALRAEHHDAGRAELLAALESARSRARAVLTAPDADTVGLRWVPSAVGDLPLTGLVVAQTLQLALTGLDLAPVAGTTVDPRLLEAGTGALVDVTGALAGRHGITTAFAVSTPEARWATGALGGDWTTLRLDADRPVRDLPWPGVAGTGPDVLAAASGRVPAVQLLVTRRLRVQGVPALVRLLPALDGVPGVPGGPALRAALRGLDEGGRVAGRLGRRISAGMGSVLRR